MSHQQKLIQRVTEYLDSQNWHYDCTGENNNVFSFGINLNCKLSSCRVLIAVSDADIQTFAVSPINATPDVYSNVVEFITRANYDMKVGKFEFDYSDGEVRYQSILICDGSVPSLEAVERCVDIPFLMMKLYGDALVKNLMGFGNPEADIKEIKRPI